jgi:hypothetical protein
MKNKSGLSSALLALRTTSLVANATAQAQLNAMLAKEPGRLTANRAMTERFRARTRKSRNQQTKTDKSANIKAFTSYLRS